VPEEILRLENLTVLASLPGGTPPLVDNVTFAVARNHTACLVGVSAVVFSASKMTGGQALAVAGFNMAKRADPRGAGHRMRPERDRSSPIGRTR
jgi:hypothetical protein